MAARLTPLKRGLAVVLGLLSLAGAASAVAQTPQTAAKPSPAAGESTAQSLDSIRAIRRLTPRQAEAQLPVRLRAVVTHFNELAFVDLHVHDRELGQYVSFSGTQRLRQLFHPGDLVEIDGFTVRGEFAPDVMPREIRIVGKAPLPVPRRYSYGELASGRHDCEWIEVTGVVQGARLIRTEQTVLALDVAVAGGSVRVQFWDFKPGDAERLIDAKIRVVGNCGTVPTATAQFRGVRLAAGHTSAIEVVRPAPDPFAAPARPLDAVLQFSADEPDPNRIRVQGLVTAQRPGVALYIQDATGGMRVETEQTTVVQPGDRVDVAGFAVATPLKPFLRSAVFRKIDGGASPQVRDVAQETALDSGYEAELVRLSGRLLGKVIGPTEQFLVVQSGDLVFRASLEGLEGVQPLGQLREGSEVAVTGIYRFAAEPPQTFRLEPRTPGDVVLLVAAPWWTPRATLVMLAALALVGGVALAWVRARKRAEEALAAEKQLLAVTLHSIGDAVIATDVDGRVVLFNRVAEQLTGWSHEEALGRPLGEVFQIINVRTRERCESPVEKVLRSGTAVALANHTALVSRSGALRVIADSGAPLQDARGHVLGVVLVFRDVTDKERLDQELARTQKLESISTLAGGIAHDFNNLLTGVLGYLSLAQRSLPEGERAAKNLRSAEKATLRARDLTQQLLTFSKGGAPVRQPAQLAELVSESVAFALRGSSVVADLALAPDLWPAEIDAGQINQAISNVVINAVQAMPAGGRLRVSAENAIVDDGRFADLPGGRYVRLSLRDTGVGIAPDVLDHIFDPYFTTKQQGSGLGLATTYSIVKNHDGQISVESVVGEGTTFTIHLPATERTISAASAPAAAPPSAGGRVLVMDDNDVVRGLLARMLSEEGYSAERASDGADALDRYRAARAAGRPFDVVIMDLTVPGGMGGKEATAQLLREDPEARVIVSSGYSTDPIMANYREHGFSGVLSKPYRVAEVAAAVREVMARPKGRG